MPGLKSAPRQFVVKRDVAEHGREDRHTEQRSQAESRQVPQPELVEKGSPDEEAEIGRTRGQIPRPKRGAGVANSALRIGGRTMRDVASTGSFKGFIHRVSKRQAA